MRSYLGGHSTVTVAPNSAQCGRAAREAAQKQHGTEQHNNSIVIKQHHVNLTNQDIAFS